MRKAFSMKVGDVGEVVGELGKDITWVVYFFLVFFIKIDLNV